MWRQDQLGAYADVCNSNTTNFSGLHGAYAYDDSTGASDMAAPPPSGSYEYFDQGCKQSGKQRNGNVVTGMTAVYLVPARLPTDVEELEGSPPSTSTLLLHTKNKKNLL